jgi:hypothetical protein
MGAGLGKALDSFLVWRDRDVSGSPGVKGVGECCARGKVSCFNDFLSVFFVAREEVLVSGKRGGLFPIRAGLEKTLMEGVL